MSEAPPRPPQHVPVPLEPSGRPLDFDGYYRQWRPLQRAVDGLQKLFVVGCAKSGTTWLMNLLHAHPQIVCRGEGSFFWELAPLLLSAVRKFNAEGQARRNGSLTTLGDIDFLLLMRTVIDSQLGRYVCQSEAKPDLRIVSDKTPMHSVTLANLDQLYPQARYIHIIRDPRDVTVSQWFFWARDNDGRSFEEFVEFSITSVWPLNVLAARHAALEIGDRYIEVRYEDLHADTTETLRQLLRFLDADDDEALLERCAQAASFERLSGGRRQGDEEPGALYRRGIVGDWRSHIPLELANACCAQVADVMEACGYEPVAPPQPAALPIR